MLIEKNLLADNEIKKYHKCSNDNKILYKKRKILRCKINGCQITQSIRQYIYMCVCVFNEIRQKCKSSKI